MASQKTISGASLILSWGIDLSDLSYFTLKHNLTVLDPAEIPSLESKIDPKKYRFDTERLIDVILGKPHKLIDMLFWFPEITLLSKKIFRQNHALRWRWEHPSEEVARAVRFGFAIPPVYCDSNEKWIKSIVENHEPTIAMIPNVFFIIGKVWYVKFRQKEFGLYPDHEKYKYIACLLDRFSYATNKDNLKTISNIELVERVKGKKSKTQVIENLDYGEDLHDDAAIANKLTKEEIDKYKQDCFNLLSKLKKASDTGNNKSVEELSEELDEYKEFLMKEYGIDLKIRQDKIYFKIFKRPSKEHEKLRQLIKNQINNAINDFKDRMPSFFRHLKNSIQLKIFQTLYLPESPIVWHVSI